MTTIKKYGLLAAGILLVAGALIVASVPVMAQSTAPRGMMNSAALMHSGSGGMMGSGMSGMMGDVDRHFIEQMIPHHQAAIEMADLALQKAQRPEIKTLAANIKRTQTAEIEQMRAWYKQWYGTDVPTNGSSASGSGMMGSGMMGNGNGSQGMMSGGMMGGGTGGGCHGAGNTTDLSKATDFDKAFIEAMIPHHQMALMMTTMEQSLGQKSDLSTLAKSMYTAQSAEIEQMRTWYQQWYGTSVPTN